MELLFYGPFLEIFFDREIMGLRAHPRRRKTPFVQQPFSMGAALFPLSSREVVTFLFFAFFTHPTTMFSKLTTKPSS